ncbi:TraM recognition domain-containing protein [Streptomyces sp. NPDC092296]|uniref:TraM recognition domain-containing protein n=1 Tax=Streptomyces sp. NPDC092296 TaxID=3366012 RepID=UPI003814A336
MTRPVPPAPAPRPPAAAHRSGVPDGAVIALLAVLLGSVALVWTATGLAATVTQGAWPQHLPFTRSAQAIRHLVAAPHDLPGAWAAGSGTDQLPSPLPSATAFWWTFLVLLAALTALLVAALAARTRLRRTPRTAPVPPAAPPHPQPVDKPPAAPAVPSAAPRPAATPPPAPAAPPPPHPLSFAALLPRAGLIRQHPDTGLAHPGARTAPNPLAYGIALGRDTATGTPLYAALDRGHCVFAPPAAARGKGPLLIHPAVIHAPGPVLVTCDGPTTWQATTAAREKTGPVRVFDPLRLTPADGAQLLRWAPQSGCADPATATARAEALLHPVIPPHSTADAAVHAAARTLLRCWLHAAALDDRPFRQVHRWSGGHGTRDAVRILRTDRGAAEGWSGELEALLTPSGHAVGAEQRDAATALLSRAFAALDELHVLQSCTPSATERPDVESLLAERATLYLVAQSIEAPHQHPGVMPLLTAFAQDVADRARHAAVRAPAGRLDPPLLAALDDVAALAPLPDLPDLVARGGTQGIATLAVLRSPEQARARWSDRTVHRLWTTAATRTILGPAEPDALHALLTATSPADPAGPPLPRPGPDTALVLHPTTATTATVQLPGNA